MGATIQLPVPLVPSIIFFVIMGSMSAMLANRGLQVFHDGLRPTVPALVNGEMSRSEISAISFALGIGFVFGFGIPLSLGLVIPVCYIIFIVTDWIGISLPGKFIPQWYKDKQSLMGFVGAGILGGLWGLFTATSLNMVANLGAQMPVDVLTPLSQVSSPIMAAFASFPTLTVAYRYGWKSGSISLLFSVLAWSVALKLGAGGGEPWALAAGMIVLAIYAINAERANAKKRQELGESVATLEEEQKAFFTQNVKRIKSAMIPIVLLSGVIGAASRYAVISVDPVQAKLFAEGLPWEAALVAFTWGLAFAPMKYTTALATGTMVTYTFFETGVAILMPNWIVAFFAVALLRVLEIYGLFALGRLFDRYEEVRAMADVLRTAIFHVMEIGLLIGGGIAANAMAPGIGFLIVVGAWWINRYADSPIMPMAVGPIAAILVGVIANILAVLGLMPPT